MRDFKQLVRYSMAPLLCGLISSCDGAHEERTDDALAVGATHSTLTVKPGLPRHRTLLEGLSEPPPDMPVVAVNPVRKDAVVLVGGDCQIFRSTDGGRTFSPGPLLPLLAAGHECSDATVAYAADGRLYAAYVDKVRKPDRTSVYQAVFSYSDNDGVSFRAPDPLIGISAWTSPGRSGSSIGTLEISASQQKTGPGYVYVSTGRFGWGPGHWSDTKQVAASASRGAAGSFVQVDLDSSSDLDGEAKRSLGRVQVRAAVGAGSLAVWSSNGKYGEVRARHSADGGKTWAPVHIVSQSADATYVPALALDADGVAHLALSLKPTGGTASRLVYMRSADSAYKSWSRPVDVERLPSGTSIQDARLAFAGQGHHRALYLLWTDDRRRTATDTEFGADVFVRSLMAGRSDFSPSRRLTPHFGRVEYLSLTTDGEDAWGFWTESRPTPDGSDVIWEVFGTRLSP